jgi:hypothetical protein
MSTAQPSSSNIQGLIIRTFTPPPAGFDALRASDRELLVYGFPTRPDPTAQPDLHAKWAAIYAKPLQHITPSFRLQQNVTHGPGHQNATDPRLVQHALSFNNWSGAVASPPAGDTFSWVAGVWKVPAPRSPAGRCDGDWYYSSTWIGIDGANGSQDVLQAGTEQDEQCVNGQVQQNLYAWWEWFPANSVAVDNFPVSVGDSISCLICAGSSTTAEVFLTNQTKNIHTAFGITAPGTTSLIGNCAEWIVERPSVNNVLTQLPDYGEADFTESFAGTAKRATVNAGSATTAIMTDDFCNNISVGAITGTQALKCNYTLPNVPLMLAAWKGVSNDQGIYFATFDGAFFRPQQNIGGIGSSVGPATALFNGKVFMAWKGVNDDQGIYFSSLTGNSWAPQQKIAGIGTSYRPALAVFNGRLFMAWKGVSNDQGIYFSSFDGASWAGQQNIGGVGTSGAVALATFNGRLFMAWKGVSGDQGIYFSSFDGSRWAAQQKVAGVGTSLGPSLAVFQNRLFMAWKGVSGDQGIWFSSFDGNTWAGQQNVSGVGTSVGPSLTVLQCKLFMCWKGIDGDQQLWYATFDGTNWSTQQNVINVGSSVGPSLAS